MTKPKLVVKTIRAATGARVIVTREAIDHSNRHFHLPEDLFLQLTARVLREPTSVFVEEYPGQAVFHLFYRIESGGFVVAVVKVKPDGSFLVTVYPTSKKIRPKHAKLRKLLHEKKTRHHI